MTNISDQLRPGTELRQTIVEAVKWLHDNEKIYPKFGWDLVDALVGRALTPGALNKRDEIVERLEDERLYRAIKNARDYFQNCHSPDGKRIAAALGIVFASL